MPINFTFHTFLFGVKFMKKLIWSQVFFLAAVQAGDSSEIVKMTEYPQVLIDIPNFISRWDLVRYFISSIENGVFVEIGTHRGEFANFILTINPTCTLYCIDPYQPYDEYHDAINNVTGDRLYNDVKENLVSKYGDRVKFVRKFSHDAINDVPDNLDFIYIDGNHQYKYVSQDLLDWYRKLKLGRYIIGDDAVDIDESKRNADGDVFIIWAAGAYGNYGVIKAFDEFKRQKNCIGKRLNNQYLIIKNQS